MPEQNFANFSEISKWEGKSYEFYEETRWKYYEDSLGKKRKATLELQHPKIRKKLELGHKTEYDFLNCEKCFEMMKKTTMLLGK